MLICSDLRSDLSKMSKEAVSKNRTGEKDRDPVRKGEDNQQRPQVAAKGGLRDDLLGRQGTLKPDYETVPPVRCETNEYSSRDRLRLERDGEAPAPKAGGAGWYESVEMEDQRINNEYPPPNRGIRASGM
ncbi:hypothetical protein NL676_012719 [Syzygium grande]|nr:hypothetical protein NL676_012719 [Syzygium grande]